MIPGSFWQSPCSWRRIPREITGLGLKRGRREAVAVEKIVCESMEFESFDADYLRRLQEGDFPTERHFTEYFSQLLLLKLRRRLRSIQDVEDVAQETLVRVFHQLRKDDGLREPEKLGAYVNTVCNYVLLEKFRALQRHPTLDPDHPDPQDDRIDMDSSLVRRDRQKFVARALEELPEKDQVLLRMVFFEERPKDEICAEMNVTPDYLRVLLHRAKNRFRDIAERFGGLPPGLFVLACLVKSGWAGN